MIYISFLIILALFLLSFKMVYSNTLLIGPWVATFTTFWTLPVAAVWYWESASYFDYALKNFADFPLPSVGDDIVLDYFLLILFSTLFLLFGCWLSTKLPVIKSSLACQKIKLNNDINISFLFLCWLLVTVYVSSTNGLPWYYTFLPVYADRPIYINYIYRGLYLYTPFLALISAVHDKRAVKVVGLIVVWGAVVSFSTGQRRDILSFFLFALYIYLCKSQKFSLSRFLTYWKAVSIFFVGMAGVVFLWAARVFSTNIIRDGEIINPFEVRGFFEIIFGSGATGIPTLFVVVDWIDKYQIQVGYNIFYGVSQLIPRFLWELKPVGIDTIIQDEYLLADSPSMFWYGDMLFSVGFYMLPVICFFLGFILTTIQRSLSAGRGLLAIITAAVLYCNLFTLYKNGMGTYVAVCLTSLTIMFFLLLLERTCCLLFKLLTGAAR